MASGTAGMLKALTFIALFPLGVVSSRAAEVRPISSNYGICLAGFSDLDLKVNGPADVEFATLIYRGHAVAQFRTNILGPEVAVPAREIDRWHAGALVLVRNGKDYLGVKRISGDAYTSAYVSLLTMAHLPGTLSSRGLMQGLVSCNLTAPLDVSPPPRIDAGVTGAAGL